MRRSAAEKMEMIRLVEQSDLPVQATLRQLGIPRSTFYGWYQRYLDGGAGERRGREIILRSALRKSSAEAVTGRPWT